MNKLITLRLRMRLALLLAFVCLSVVPAGAQQPARASADVAGLWTAERAHRWYQNVGQLRGFNYLPRTAVNDVEMWQAATFDPKTIDQELGWARAAGYNSARVFLQFVVWQENPAAYKRRIERYLRIADKHRISTMLILFDDVAFAGKEPKLGKQPDPVPGVHNSQWVPSPAPRMVTDKSQWGELERYTKDIIKAFGRDRRVIVWDLYNEPGNNNLKEKSLPLVEAAFAWAREVKPIQPLTTGVWREFETPMARRIFELSDIVSYHDYEAPEVSRKRIDICRAYGRPVLNTEWLRRQVGNTFAAELPLFAENNIGWYHWGLVQGRTQTYMPWGSKEGDPEPKVWQHDVFRADGTPYDPQEFELIRAHLDGARRKVAAR